MSEYENIITIINFGPAETKSYTFPYSLKHLPEAVLYNIDSPNPDFLGDKSEIKM